MTEKAIITIDTGVKRVLVENKNGKTHELVFNPSDVVFVEKLHQLYSNANEKVKALDKFSKKLDEPELDKNGIPIDTSNFSTKTREINEWFRGELDYLLGDGTSQAIYGDAILYGETFGAYTDLLVQLMAFVAPVRDAKTEKYRAKKVSKKTSARTKAG
jgi:hypothetical protein